MPVQMAWVQLDWEKGGDNGASSYDLSFVSHTRPWTNSRRSWLSLNKGSINLEGRIAWNLPWNLSFNDCLIFFGFEQKR